jgi:hypothetical protein
MEFFGNFLDDIESHDFREAGYLVLIHAFIGEEELGTWILHDDI